VMTERTKEFKIFIPKRRFDNRRIPAEWSAIETTRSPSPMRRSWEKVGDK
jgi:hypothetical protein